MLLDLEKNNKCLIAKFKGELDHHSSESTREKIDNYYLENNLQSIILDLRGLTFMDSSGIGLIMGRYKNTIDRKGKLIVINDNNYVERILNMSGLLKIVELYPSIDIALNNL
ncbi:MAG TPA: anti-sigma F factor antagonist [Tissierellaceae bacterium]|nr:anti-sigma F factor antagonist [Tissierellaceae bacterium]